MTQATDPVTRLEQIHLNELHQVESQMLRLQDRRAELRSILATLQAVKNPPPDGAPMPGATP